MRLRKGGIDIFYIDESHDRKVYVVTAVAVPFLRQIEGQWTLVWENHLGAAKSWRKRMKNSYDVPRKKELHGNVLASGRGHFLGGKHNFKKPKANAVYRRILEDIDFLPESSVMTASTNRGRFLYGKDRLEAALTALFQRLRNKCIDSNVNAITFFDQGHPEYRKLYRQAQVYLPTGSKYGSSTRNLPLSMFTKDGNEKDSKHCLFTQTADLVAYSAFLKLKGERGELEAWQKKLRLENLYDSIPAKLLNIAVSHSGDGIVRY